MNTATGPQITATDWLRHALFAGAVESAQIKVKAEQAGIGTKALRNARERLGVACTRQGHGTSMHSVWSLPVGACARLQTKPESIRAPIPSTAALLTIVKVSNEASNPKAPVKRAANSTTRATLVAGQSGRAEVRVADHQMLLSCR